MTSVVCATAKKKKRVNLSNLDVAWAFPGASVYMTDQRSLIACQVSCSFSTVSLVCLLECLSQLASTPYILRLVFSEHGMPENLLSNNGGHFSSRTFTKFAQAWSFNLHTSSPHYPQSNGFKEHQVQTIKNTSHKQSSLLRTHTWPSSF